jgi:signal transduction histidine kinase
MSDIKQPAIAILLFTLAMVGHACSLPDGVGSIVNPVTGVLIAFIFASGWRVLFPATVAIWLANLLKLSSIANDVASLQVIWISTALTAALLLQVVCAVVLIRYVLGNCQNLENEWRFLKLILICSAIPALISSSTAVALLQQTGFIKHSLQLEWIVAYAAELLSIAVFFPLVNLICSEFARQRHRRWLTVTIPVLVILGVFVVGLHFVATHECEQFHSEFKQQTDHLNKSIVTKLDQNTETLYSVAGLFESSSTVTRTDFQIFVNSILVRRSGIKALVWIPRIAPSQQSMFKSSIADDAKLATGKLRKSALQSFELKNWDESDHAWHPDRVDPTSIWMPTMFVEPFCKNEELLGTNWASHPQALKALTLAYETEEARSSAPLYTAGAGEGNAAYLVLLKVGRIHSLTLNDLGHSKNQIPQGFVAAVLHFDKMFPAAELNNVSETVAFKAMDVSEKDNMLLKQTGHSAYENSPDRMLYQSSYLHSLGGRRLKFVFEPTTQALNNVHGYQADLTIFLGSIVLLLLEFVLIMVTGRAESIEHVVKHRTSQLNKEVIERQRAQNELERKAFALERSNLELDRFAYVASHDLKAPLRAIDQLSQWISEDIGDNATTDTKRHVEIMQNRVRRLERLLDDLLDYARADIDLGKATLVDLNAIVDEIRFLLDLPDGFKLVINDELPIFETEKTAIEICFRNLISNSLKHHHKNSGTIEIGYQDFGKYFEFYVTDDGPGIELQYREQVFDMFRTLKPRDQVEGSGMGLALVKKIVSAIHGKIWIESNDRPGTTVRFRWPKRSTMNKVELKQPRMIYQNPPSSVAR